MLIGPIFSREAAIAPRRVRFFAVPTVIVAGLAALTLTLWQLLVGTQDIRTPGDYARFGAAAFELLAPLLLTVAVLFSALFSAAAIAQEKDKKTLLLLLLTDLSNSELVLGRLLASLLTVLLAVVATTPLLLALALFGGVAPGQIFRALAVILLSAIAAGSLGSTLALWREKSFQAIALTAIVLLLWFVGWEAVGQGVLGSNFAGYSTEQLATAMSPWRALTAAMAPEWSGVAASELVNAFGSHREQAAPLAPFAFGSGVLILLLNGLAIALVRVWNPSREARPQASPEGDLESAIFASTAEEARSQIAQRALAQRTSAHAAPGALRPVWSNPVLWREIRTWAYGKKILIVKFAYLAIFALCAFATLSAARSDSSASSVIPPAAAPLAPLLLVSVVLVNALGVTSLTTERDGKSLELLLATDLTPRELIVGKVLGAFYNAKEMILLPLLLGVALAWMGSLSWWQFGLYAGAILVLDAFAAVLGLHAGMTYVSSRSAIAVSIGTLLFLFLGVSICMRMMLALSTEFEKQMISFLVVIVGGGVGLAAVLGWRKPSAAITSAAVTAPFTIFYAITAFLTAEYTWVFLATSVAFGFATVALLVPALDEFDVVTARTSARDL